MKYLLKYEDCYADEFNVNELFLITEEEKSMIENGLNEKRNSKFYFLYGFGTNEEIEYYSVEELEEAIKIFEITDREIKVLEKFDAITEGYFVENLLETLYGIIEEEDE